MGTDSELTKYSIKLSVDVVAFYKWLVAEKKEFVMSKQILRSATSIGANIHEAYYAVSKADFIAKMQIALKEASETEYWLIILERTGFFDARFDLIKSRCNSLKKMLISTLNTSKKTKDN
jgi:four helix bundle protein